MDKVHAFEGCQQAIILAVYSQLASGEAVSSDALVHVDAAQACLCRVPVCTGGAVMKRLWPMAQCCLRHVGDNEIDSGLLDLLQENIDAAKAAGQTEASQFMEKVRDAARKFVLS